MIGDSGSMFRLARGMVLLFLLLIVQPFFTDFHALAVSAHYKSIIERNPFDPKRGQDKTALEGGAVSSEASDLEQRYSVYGIIMAGSSKSAFIKPVKSDKRGQKQDLRKIFVGDMVDGWTVKDITDKGLLLVSGEDQVVLKVFGSPKKERRSDRPVGVATPKPVPERPAIKPADQKRLKAAAGNSGPQKIKPGFIFPKKQSAVNPFLKALQRQKEREKRP